MYLVNLGSTVSGWYAYAPLSQAVYPPRTGLAGWLRLIIWLALAGRNCPGWIAHFSSGRISPATTPGERCAIRRCEREEGFRACLEPVSDPSFDGARREGVKAAVPADEDGAPVLFTAGSMTLTRPDHPVLAVALACTCAFKFASFGQFA